MAQKELLRVLVTLLFSALIMSKASMACAQDASNIEIADAKDEQIEWAADLRKQGQLLTKKAIMEKLKELDQLSRLGGDDHKLSHQSNNKTEFVNNKAALKIFVSFSMPKSLLKAYHNQARKYGAALVFKGLPGGSFKELSKLALAIAEDSDEGSMQIDDEAFERFGINSVPAILLIKEEDCLGECFEQSGKVAYDKISGSIGIKAALEKFAQDGELAEEARRLQER